MYNVKPAYTAYTVYTVTCWRGSGKYVMLTKSESHTHKKISQFKMGADGQMTKGCSQVVSGGITSGHSPNSEFNSNSSIL